MRNEDGRGCPEREHAPQTIEGRAVMAALDRSGVWRFAGMNGELAGIELADAMASLPQGCDVEFSRRLLIDAEAGYLRGHSQKIQEEKSNADTR